MKKKVYYQKLDLIRIISCLAVLFYHLGLLKGGYLAVCTFFVLSGYLAVSSAFNKKEFSYREYYKSRFIKLYIPLIIVVFVSIGITSLFSNIYWLSMKSETTSVLLGYNNFWQISANLDYFARHIDSPFMHFWYIAILIQFELVFPFIFKLLKSLGDKFNKILPCIIMLILSISSIVYFYMLCKSGNSMDAYYNTFARSYALFLGLFLGFYKNNYKSILASFIHNKIIIFSIYLIILILSFFLVSYSSKYFAISMIIVSILSMRLIDYATIDKDIKLNKLDNIIKPLVGISYEMYIIQYPVIFLFQYININSIIKIPLIILLVLVLSFILHEVINKGDRMKKFKKILIILIVLISLFGVYKYINAKSIAKDMKQLEQELARNEKIMLEKQKEYQLLEDEEEASWQEKLSELENSDNYEQMVKDLPVTFIGDSVMLGAMNNIKAIFVNSYFDAMESRPIVKALTIIEELKEKNILGNPVVIHLGTNGDCSNGCKEKIMDLLLDKDVFWINTTNSTEFNDSLNSLKDKYSNLHIIDWYKLSSGHEDWFYVDGIHLPTKGRSEYTNIVYNAILDVYKTKYENQKQELIKAHQEDLKNKPAFYGDDVLLYNFDELKNKFSDAKFIVDKDLSFTDVKESIEKSLKENTLSNKIVLVFSKDNSISNKEYKELIGLCNNSKVYIVSLYNSLNSLSSYKNVTIIDYYSKLNKNKDYLLKDGSHLSDEGNNALLKLISKTIK